MKVKSSIINKELIYDFEYCGFYISLIFRKNNITNKIYVEEYVEIKECSSGRHRLDATDEERKRFGINKIVNREKLKMKKVLILRGW